MVSTTLLIPIAAQPWWTRKTEDRNMDRVIIVQIREDDELLMMAYGCRL